MKRRGRARKRPLNRFGVFRAFSPARFIFNFILSHAFPFADLSLLFSSAIPHIFVRNFSLLKSLLFSPSVSKTFAKYRQENTKDFASFDDKK